MRNYFFSKIKGFRLNLIDLIVIVCYYLFFVLLVFSLLGLFNGYWLSGIFLLILLFVFGLNPKIGFSKSHLWFFILIPLFFIGFILFKGYFSSDSVTYWLPWAREIVWQGQMPDFLTNTHIFINSRMPLLPLFAAGIFTFLPLKSFFALAIPLFFAAATVLLLYQWVREKGIKKHYLIFVVFLFLTVPVTVKYGGEILQESLVLFFFTAFFYYLERYQEKSRVFDFCLMLFSFVLALASKLTGLVLILPLAWVLFKNRIPQGRYWFYYFLIFSPIIIWFIRNFLIYQNPMPLISVFNNLFGGPYSELVRNSINLYLGHDPIEFNNIFIRVGFIIKNILFSLPFVLLSFYGFWRAKRNFYLIFVLTFFFAAIFVFLGPDTVIRYFYPLIGLLIIYAFVGLGYLRSKLLASGIFFFAFWGLLGTEISLSQNQAIACLEKLLNSLISFSQFVFDYRIIWALIWSFFFYFFVANKKYWPYLILLIFSSYLVKTSTIQISWLNTWLPILFLIFLVLIWRYFDKLKEAFLRKLVVGYIIILLILASWGLALSFFVINHQFVFPKAEAYGILPQVVQEIQKIEGSNKDFYVYVAYPTYLTWYHNYKVVGPDTFTFYYLIEDLKCCDDYTAQEIYNIFKENNIKYLVKNVEREFWQDFFDKIEQELDLFELIFEENGSYLWKVK